MDGVMSMSLPSGELAEVLYRNQCDPYLFLHFTLDSQLRRFAPPKRPAGKRPTRPAVCVANQQYQLIMDK
jgi:hypothetical protein